MTIRTKRVAVLGAIALSASVTLAVAGTPAGAAGAAAPAKCSKTGGSFVDNYSFSSTAPEHLDPGLNSELIGAQLNNMLWDGLTHADAVTDEVKPAVAESWKVSSDGKAWTFKLRKGVKFSNGEAVLPSTFKSTWELNASAAYASDYAGLVDVFANGNDYIAGKATSLSVDADDAAMTLTVNLAAPYGLLAERMTHNFFFPKTKEAVAAGKNWESKGPIIGNGPFKVEKIVTDQSYKLVRNESYYGGIYNRGTCLDSVTFKVSKDPLVAYADFEAGNSNNGVIPVGKFTEATTKYGDRATRPVLSTNWIGFNWQNPVVGGISNSLLRAAIGNSIDRDSMNKILFDNSRIVAKGLTPPGIPGYKAKLTANFQSGTPNLRLAKKQIAAYRKKTGGSVPEVQMWFRNTSTESSLAQLVQANAKEIGVTVKLEPQPSKGYFTAVRKGNPQMFLNGWIWDYAGYDNGANELFHSKDDFTASNNLSDFKAPTFDRLTEQALTEPNPAKRAKLYQQAESFLLDSGVMIPTFHGRVAMVLAKSVDFFPITPLGFIEYQLATVK